VGKINSKGRSNIAAVNLGGGPTWQPPRGEAGEAVARQGGERSVR